MAVKKKGNARKAQRAKRKVSRAAKQTVKHVTKSATVARRRVQHAPTPQAVPQGDGDSTPLHGDVPPYDEGIGHLD